MRLRRDENRIRVSDRHRSLSESRPATVTVTRSSLGVPGPGWRKLKLKCVERRESLSLHAYQQICPAGRGDAAAVLVTKSYKPYQARRPSRYRPVDHAGAPSSWRGRGRS